MPTQNKITKKASVIEKNVGNGPNRAEKVVNFEKTKITKPYCNKKILSLSKNNRKRSLVEDVTFKI